MHLHCTDVAGEWTVRPNDAGGFDVTREHAKGDCAIRGAASDILLALWRRRAAVDASTWSATPTSPRRFVARTSLD